MSVPVQGIAMTLNSSTGMERGMGMKTHSRSSLQVPYKNNTGYKLESGSSTKDSFFGRPDQWSDMGYSSKSLPLEDATATRWNTLERYVADHRAEQRACLRVPLYVILTVTSIMIGITHIPLSETKAVNDAMANFVMYKPRFGFASTKDIVGDRTFEDVHTMADFYSWFRSGFLPLAQRAFVEVSETERLRLLRMRNVCEEEVRHVFEERNRSSEMSLRDMVVMMNHDHHSGPSCPHRVSPRCCKVMEILQCLTQLDNGEDPAPDICKEIIQRGPSGEQPNPMGELFRSTTVVSGFRLRQKSIPETDCKIPLNSREWWGDGSTSNVPKCFSSNSFFDKPSQSDVIESSEMSGHEEYFPLSMTRGQMLEKARDLELGCPTMPGEDSYDPRSFTANMYPPASGASTDSPFQYQFDSNTSDACAFVSTEHVKNGKPWTQDGTIQIELEFVTLNRDLGLWSMTTVNFVQNRAGKIFKVVDTVSQFIAPYNEMGRSLIALDALFLLLNLLVLISVVYGFVHTVSRKWKRASRLGLQSSIVKKRIWTCAKHFFYGFIASPSIYLVVVSILIVYQWINQLLLIAKFNDMMSTDVNGPLNKLGVDTLAKVFEAAKDTLNGKRSREFRTLFCFYLLLSLYMVLFAFHHSPRLSFVSRTIVAAGSQLINFLIVFCFILVVFSAAAHIAFGCTSEDFVSFGSSGIAMYRASFGEFSDQDAFEGEDDIFSRLFFISFTVVCTLVMLNVGLAILLEAYDVMKQQTERRQSLHLYYIKYAKSIWQRLRYKYLSFGQIYTEMKKYKEGHDAKQMRSGFSDRTKNTKNHFSPSYAHHPRSQTTLPSSTSIEFNDHLVDAQDLSSVIILSMPLEQAVALLIEVDKWRRKSPSDSNASEANCAAVDMRSALSRQQATHNQEMLRMLNMINKRFDQMDAKMDRTWRDGTGGNLAPDDVSVCPPRRNTITAAYDPAAKRAGRLSTWLDM
eukprot:GEMP01004081.1.p1 GENE.GEMP01004081.1~~GEMP01004081.1.p1  ORF type:complete len:969 (+),score=132.26 GEMP01004081.1:140-3046(+)